MSKKILIVSDKYKSCLSSEQVALSIRSGFKQHSVTIQPVADGGDGSIDILKEKLNLKECALPVYDPLFRKIESSYCFNQSTAFIELAKASGLHLLNGEERSPMLTSSYGTGEMIVNAVKRGINNVYLFIGGSATNDAGIGIASALGYQFLDSEGQDLKPIGSNLGKVDKIILENPNYLKALKLSLVCDVNHVFFGKEGAAYSFASQKGASDKELEYLDQGLSHINRQFVKHNFEDVGHQKGAGAAGGIGGGLKALLHAELLSGIDFFIETFDINNKIKNADIIITGEGQLDSTSFQGKVVGGIYDLCKQHDKPLYIVCGDNKLVSSADTFEHISNSILSVMDFCQQDKHLAMTKTADYLTRIGETISHQIESFENQPR